MTLKKENSLSGHIIGVLAIVFNMLLIVAEILFLKFGIVILVSFVLLLMSLIAFRNTKFKMYEICAAVCILNILILGSILVKESGFIPIIDYNIVD